MPSIPRTAFARGTRAACACVAKLPNCSWLAPHLNAFRLRFVFSKDVPGCAHLAHLAVIARGVFDIQLRCVHGLAALKAGFISASRIPVTNNVRSIGYGARRSR